MTTLQIRRKMRRRKMQQPIGRNTLSQCLVLLGMSPDKTRRDGRKGFMLKAGRAQHSHADNSEGRLYDLYEMARPAYLKLCKRYRIHLGHNHEFGVWITALWSHTVKLFRRKGIEI